MGQYMICTRAMGPVPTVNTCLCLVVHTLPIDIAFIVIKMCFSDKANAMNVLKNASGNA